MNGDIVARAPHPMIKAVFFDLYNTLCRFYPQREQIQIAAAAQFGLRPSPDGIVKGYNAADKFMTEQNAIRHVQKRSEEERDAFFAEYERLILKGAGIEVTAEVAEKVWRKVREAPSELALYDDVLPTLEILDARGLKLGVISNIYRDLQQLCEDLDIAQYMDFVVSSMTAGAEKPHPPIFLAALAKAGVKPHEAMHVGDQYAGDVAGARGVGIRPVLLDRDHLLLEHTDVDRIVSLTELPRLTEQ
ncbi:MAG: HAD-IA family hydrolase [Chloroflexi bacterium]|nr:HAD-IA family hydrolase [Chloroflexota bacterium]